MSSVFNSLLNNSFTAWQPQRADDGQGGWLLSYSNVGTVQGRLRPRGGSELNVADQDERRVPHVLYVKASDTVGSQIGRDFLITPAADATLIFQVQGVREPSLAGEHLEIDCYQRQLAANEVLGGS